MSDWPISDASRLWMEGLPNQFRQIIEDAVPRLLAAFPNLLVIGVVGSLAEGTYDEHSDVDLFLVRRGPTGGHDVFRDIRRDWKTVNFIISGPEHLRVDHNDGATGAWAVRRSVVLYDPQGVMPPYVATDPPPPRRQWAEDRLREIARWDMPRVLQGKILALAQLLVALNSLPMPTTKRHIRDGLLAVCQVEAIRQAMIAATRRGSTPEQDHEDLEAMQNGLHPLQDLVQQVLLTSDQVRS